MSAPVTSLPILPPRPDDCNKGSFGRVLVVAGSRGMSGAAVLCASAALRAGAGLVRVAVPREALPLVAVANPCYMTAPVPDEDGKLAASALDEIVSLAKESTVCAVGPGLGRAKGVTEVVTRFIGMYDGPIVLDADGLNAFAETPGQLSRHGGALIITPHPGEFARLLGVTVAEVQSQRAELAERFAREHRLIVVLKGHHTIVTDGDRLYENTTGNPGMATAGAGDVLTGAIAALMGQHLEPFAAAQLGVHIHGLAGDLARDAMGRVGIIASDLVDFLPRALRA